jgi:hypothetical protein
MDTTGRRFLAARWSDDRGDNVLGGFVVDGAQRLTLLSLNYGEVEVPDGAVITRPNRAGAIVVGVVVGGVIR